MRKYHFSAHAAATAFFLFLSFVPMLLIVSTILPYTALSKVDLQEVVIAFAPKMVTPLLMELIGEVYETSNEILPIAILTAVWSAGKGIKSLIHGLNVVNEIDEKRGFFSLRLMASLYTVIMLLVLLAFMTLNVFGNQLHELILANIPGAWRVLSFVVHFRFLLVWAMMTLVFSSLYAFLPDQKKKFKDQITGAAFTAVMWSIFSWGFSVFVTKSRSFGIYGSVSIIVILLIWMYFFMYFVIIGAYLNRILEDQYELF
jgi:membrane protein